ncbi:hypothetical protein [Chitinophaga sp. GbtcB8]|uniref:hypothetical protein n=1 Tax=Chitinophaga sp. GbtcB8 TaxID=2824753 RepID=UPI001C2F79A7|nr:hypothetical protein [Chitinophaga sp. GbtcB8]
MSYYDFNSKALTFYTQRAKTSFCSFSLDESEFALLIAPTEVGSFEILKADWTSLAENGNDVPRYFGLIALQCFAATLMEDGDEVTERAYKFRLKKLIEPKIDLHLLFKAPFGTQTIQEKIWYDAKQFLEHRFGLRLEIPSRKTFAGRYVQYPLSQLLLKTEDLKDFTVFFAEHFLPEEDIPFDFFRKKLKEWFPRTISPRAEKLLSDPLKQERCYEQLFNYFQSWSGEVIRKQRKGTYKIRNISKAEDKQVGDLILMIDHGQHDFFFKKKAIQIDEVFTLPGCHYFHRGILLFNPVPDYETDYEHSRFLYLNAITYLLVDRTFKAKEYDFLEKHASSKYLLAPSRTLFCYSLLSIGNSHPLQGYFYHVNPVFLSGGIKLGRANLFLTGFGPRIDYREKFNVLFENRPVEYDPQTALPGDYKVRVTHYRDVRFSIMNVNSFQSIAPLLEGWDFHSLTVTEHPMLEGCMFYLTDTPAQHPIRAWINANLAKKVNKIDRDQNLILTPLSYANKKTFKR